MELTGGIHRVDGVRGANCYLVPGADGLYLVDTGMPNNALRVLRYLKSLDRAAKDLRMILLTHSDIDHAGSAAELRRKTGAKIAIHEADAPVVSGQAEGKKVKGALGALFRVMSKLMRIEKFQADVILKDGEKVGPVTVIATPGHTQGSVCFLHEGSQTLLAGDALRTNRGGDVVTPPQVMNFDNSRTWESAERISTLSFEALLPGHGQPLLQSAA
jgi:glyoxylase-like metal-dependent hydrolase (beta-lactamase superfamily II)